MESLFQIGLSGFQYKPVPQNVENLCGWQVNHSYDSSSLTNIYAVFLNPSFNGITSKRIYVSNTCINFAATSSTDSLYGNFIGGKVDGSATNVYGLYVDCLIGGNQIVNSYAGYFKTPAIGGNKFALYADDLHVGSVFAVTNAGDVKAGNISSSVLSAASLSLSGGIACADISAANVNCATITSVGSGSFSAINAGGCTISGSGISFSGSGITFCSSGSSSISIHDLSFIGGELNYAGLFKSGGIVSGPGKFTSVESASAKLDSATITDATIVNINGSNARLGTLDSQVVRTVKLESSTITADQITSGTSIKSDSFETGSATIDSLLIKSALRLGIFNAPSLVCANSSGDICADSSSVAAVFRSLSLASPLGVASGGTGYSQWNSGELFVSGSKLPLGAEGYVLTSQAGQVIWKSCPGNVLSVSGTDGHIITSSTVGDVVLSLPQAIHTGAVVAFKSLGLSDSLDVAGLARLADVKCNSVTSSSNIGCTGLSVSGNSVLADASCTTLTSSGNVSGVDLIGLGRLVLSDKIQLTSAPSSNCVASFASSITPANGAGIGYGMYLNNKITSDANSTGLYLNNNISSRSVVPTTYGLYIDAGTFDCVGLNQSYGAYIKRPAFGDNRVALFAENLVVADGAEIGGPIKILGGLTGLLCVDQVGNLSSTTSGIAGALRSLTVTEPIASECGGTGIAEWNAGEIPIGTDSGRLGKMIAGSAGYILVSNGPDARPSWRLDTLSATPITGTANCINVSMLSDKILLSTPQPISTSSCPQFARLGLGVGANDRYPLDVAGVAKFVCGYADRMALGAYSGTDPTSQGSFVTSGAVGIGTNSPQYSLDVNGPTRINSSIGIGCAPNSTYVLSVNGPTGLYGSVDVTGRLSVGSLETTGRILSEGGLIANTKALATNATDGYLYSTATMGIPIGAPTVQPGVVPMVYDLTNNTQYVFNEGWKNVGGAVVIYANGTCCAVDGTLSRLCVKQSCIIRGAAWFNGNKTMAGYFDTIAVQQPGDFSLSIGGQIKSAGNGTTHVKVTRASAVIYDQTYTVSISSDGSFTCEHILLDMRVGDVIIMDACEKTGAYPPSSITDPTPYSGGRLIMKLI
jgi:hypothetical protein